MMRSILLLLAAPLGSAIAQASPIQLTVSAPNSAAFRIVGFERDSADRPLIARGRLQVVTESPAVRGGGRLQGMEVTALDTVTPIHVEATQNGRVIASGDGVYLNLHRDTSGIAIEAKSSVPAAVARTLRRPH